MSNSIFEEEQKPAAGMPTSQQKIEKQARQLAYDIRYDVKKEIGDKPVSPAIMKQLLLKRWQRSSSAPNIKLRARQMLFGEDYIGNVGELVSETVAHALFKVFVENNNLNDSEQIELNYFEELNQDPSRKYKVRVTDKKTGNSYVRYATREKISQLRLNPNIQSVEMTEYGEPREGERRGGEQTAAAKAGKDYDRDGKIESPAKEYRGVIHNAIQRKKGGKPDGQDTSSVKEEFLSDAATEDQNSNKITGKNVNNYAGKNPAVKVMPEDPTSDRTNTGVRPRSVYAHYESDGKTISESGYAKFLKKLNEKMNISKTEMGKVIKDFQASDAPQFKGKSKKKRQQMAIAAKLESERKEEMDMRELPTKMNIIKNKMRSMGLRCSYEQEGEMIDEDLSLIIDYMINEEIVNTQNDAIDTLSTISESALAKIVSRAIPGVIKKAGTKLSKTKLPPKVDPALKFVRDQWIKKYGPESMMGTPEQRRDAARIAAQATKNPPSRPTPRDPYSKRGLSDVYSVDPTTGGIRGYRSGD